jgi:hypothetical protein
MFILVKPGFVRAFFIVVERILDNELAGIVIGVH